MTTIKILKEKVFKAGFVLRTEIIESPCVGEPLTHTWTMAYTPDGDYIGDYKMANYLCVKRGIQPILRLQTSHVCSIGFSNKDGKWYGWSHRAICGFKIGSKCKQGDCHYNSIRGEWTAKTVADAKQMACDFAESVS
jgi:hypothetical protein